VDVVARLLAYGWRRARGRDSWLNSRFIGRFGLRRVGHGAAVAFAVVAAAHAAIALSGHETLLIFIVMQGLAMLCFAFTSSNISTLAMGAYGADRRHGVLGPGRDRDAWRGDHRVLIGRAFDGTATPFLVGVAACAATALLLIVATEPKRLFAGVDPTPGRSAEPCLPEDFT